MGRPFPPVQNCPSHGGIWTPSNTWFSGPTKVLNPNSISIGSAVFAGLTSVTDRLTDHATRLVTIGRIYIRSTATWPNLTRMWADAKRDGRPAEYRGRPLLNAAKFACWSAVQ